MFLAVYLIGYLVTLVPVADWALKDKADMHRAKGQTDMGAGLEMVSFLAAICLFWLAFWPFAVAVVFPATLLAGLMQRTYLTPKDEETKLFRRVKS